VQLPNTKRAYCYPKQGSTAVTLHSCYRPTAFYNRSRMRLSLEASIGRIVRQNSL